MKQKLGLHKLKALNRKKRCRFCDRNLCSVGGVNAPETPPPL